jgi:hypothetical protein
MPTYIESVFEILKDQMVEVYIGDTFESISYSDSGKNNYAVLIGKFVDAKGDCLVLDSVHRISKKLVHGNRIYVNGYNIFAIVALDGNGSIRDAVISADDSPFFQPHGKIK